MKTLRPYLIAIVLVSLTGALLLIGRPAHLSQAEKKGRIPAASPTESALALVLIPPGGDTASDREIRELQDKIKVGPNRSALLERLGWAYVNAARLTNDPGFYKLAEACASAIDEGVTPTAEAALLRGHIYEALHRFADAEQIARELVARRIFAFDYALLGDALMEQGRLLEAVEAYQKMVDLKPCLQTYSRIAHLRWLKGDLPGALEMARVAAASGSPREPEATAWAFTRFGIFSLQSGDDAAAIRSSELACELVPDFAPALLLRARLFTAQSKPSEAVRALEVAAEKNPMPEYLWALADALRADGRELEAKKAEAKMLVTGRGNDPRTFALFLSTRGIDPTIALELAQAELASRRDIFTHDALAWAQFQNGDLKAALENSALALAENTQDARLFYHAAVIAAAAHDDLRALALSRKAEAIGQMLLPSERAGLDRQVAALTQRTSALSAR